jgi:hypothetical protein
VTDPDLPRDLGHPRQDNLAGLIAGVVIGLALLGLCLLGLALSVFGGI